MSCICPLDRLQGSDYKYILTGIDVASRYKIARPMRTKKAKDVAFLLKHIYENDKIPLTYPKVFQCDNGSEFKADVDKLLKSKGVVVRRAVTKYRHTHTTFVEGLNKIIAMSLFKIMDAQELNKKGKVSHTWVRYLYDLIDKLNNIKVDAIDKKPVEAIEMDEVQQKHRKIYADEEILPLDGLYRYLLKPGEEHGDSSKRATDNNWSIDVFRLDRVIDGNENRAMYYLVDGPERSFVREELLLIPEDTELPPDYVQLW